VSKEAQNVKISSKAWEMLRWAKFELNEKSYSDVLIKLDGMIQNRAQSLLNALKEFDENRHRIESKIPGELTVTKSSKTILLRPDAHKILSRLKLESNKSAYTFSDGIEFLIQQNTTIWGSIPDRLK
jgi:predicted CopG family antitoxin